MAVKFARLDKKETAILDQIVERALPFYGEKNPPSREHIEMNLRAVHSVCPLDFNKLLQFPDFGFLHDIFGIDWNLNKDTGELMNHFLPRCAKR